MKRVAVLGSTGSIGTQALDIVARHRDRLEIRALAAHRNVDLLRVQGEQWPLADLAVFDEEVGRAEGIKCGLDRIVEMVTADEIDLVVVAVAGVVGLVPTMAAVRAGKDIALASKEVLVAAGEVVMPLVAEYGVTLTPIDSEHSAVFQCMQGYRSDQVARLILTASGGPFRGRTKADLESVSLEQALNHPTWRMGGKITIDSATLMNKALETIEAKWLFGLEMDQVDIVVHPQSVVHSFVEMKDGSTLAQCGWPDMRLPIQYALLYPERVESGLKTWSPSLTPHLTFEEPDFSTFPGPLLARKAVLKGGTTACAMNSANEEAVAQFLGGKGTFLGIVNVVEEVVELHTPLHSSFDNIIGVDVWARRKVREILGVNE